MKAITLIQPWATCIAWYGKRIENRSWAPPASLIGQRIALHAGRKTDWNALAELHRDGIPINTGELVSGAIVAIGTLKGVVTGVDRVPAHQWYWWCGPVGWVLSDVQPLQQPVPCRGAQGLWDLTAEVEARLLQEACQP